MALLAITLKTCGLGGVAASERLRVARVLPSLPRIRDEFSRGKISWSKVRSLTRIATPANESHLCDLAMCATATQVDKIVRAMRKISAIEARQQIETRSCTWSVHDDGSTVLVLKVPTETGHAVINGINANAKFEKGVPYAQTAADTLVGLILEDGTVHGEVVVHVHPDQVTLEDGPAIAPEIAEALACNGAVTTVMETPDGPVELDRQRAANRRQRRWLAYRHRNCQIKGCDHTGAFDVHHVIERGKGGRTRLSNLVRLCAFHHRLIHLHHLIVTLNPDRTIELTFPAGNPLDRPINELTFEAPEPDAGDAIGLWYGDKLYLDLVTFGLLHGPTADRYQPARTSAQS
jgi:hypothetical protein